MITGNLVNLTWQTGIQLLRFVFLFTREENSHTYQQKSPKLTGTNRFVTNNEKKKGLLADNQQIGFLEDCVSAEPSNRHTHRGGSKRRGYVCIYDERVIAVSHANGKMHDRLLAVLWRMTRHGSD